MLNDQIRVGIYGGTFAPVHNGHVAAAKAFIECLTSAEGQTLGSEYNASIRFSNKNFVNNNPNAFLPSNGELKFNEWDVATLVEKKAEILDHWNRLYAEINGQS